MKVKLTYGFYFSTALIHTIILLSSLTSHILYFSSTGTIVGAVIGGIIVLVVIIVVVACIIKNKQAQRNRVMMVGGASTSVVTTSNTGQQPRMYNYNAKGGSIKISNSSFSAQKGGVCVQNEIKIVKCETPSSRGRFHIL
jgi:uncharacterized membrane protein